MEHFKLELIEYLDYYNNRKIKPKAKRACRLQFTDSKPFRLLEQFLSEYCLTFWGHFKIMCGDFIIAS